MSVRRPLERDDQLRLPISDPSAGVLGATAKVSAGAAAATSSSVNDKGRKLVGQGEPFASGRNEQEAPGQAAEQSCGERSTPNHVERSAVARETTSTTALESPTESNAGKASPRTPAPVWPNPAPRYLDVSGAAAYLAVPVSFVRRLVLERRVRYYKLGKYLRFDPVDLDNLVTGARVDPLPDLRLIRRAAVPLSQARPRQTQPRSVERRDKRQPANAPRPWSPDGAPPTPPSPAPTRVRRPTNPATRQ